MQFDSFADFIAMGGYGFYVWLSFGSCALILLGILFSSLNDTKRPYRRPLDNRLPHPVQTP